VSPERSCEVVLVRHAETEWSLGGRHTGRTDIPLSENGRTAARVLAGRLQAWHFQLVLVSPSLRARETCELCGLGERAQVREDLLEWDYGDYEGLTSPQIRDLRPGWNLWRDGAPAGESAGDVGARVDRVIAETSACSGPVAVFSHGHTLRVLGARWIGLSPDHGSRLGLATGALCLLGEEHQRNVLVRWNEQAEAAVQSRAPA
jgi:broad specificity phosphatase PhoE